MGRDLDQIRLRYTADVYSGPTLAQWIQQSRNSSWPTAQPVPPEVRQALQGWFSDDLFNNVRWKIGDGGAINLANATLTYGTAEAICLIDTIVFKNAQVASDLSVWAHEMVHVQQFRALGVNAFAADYARSSNSLENPAYDVQSRFSASQQGTATPPPSPPPLAVQPPTPPPPPRFSNVCRYGPHPMAYCIIPSMGPPGGYCGCGPQGVPVGMLQ
ncbi:eCIS core domain-containing protein [Bradyrhizobium huanghuaihaiense]|uniref:eCIS core domain-containing protein n=1 Tax=Bradyrhizobium huanghuaihaiense TaxID=990078 RepID=UPI003CC6631D